MIRSTSDVAVCCFELPLQLKDRCSSRADACFRVDSGRTNMGRGSPFRLLARQGHLIEMLAARQSSYRGFESQINHIPALWGVFCPTAIFDSEQFRTTPRTCRFHGSKLNPGEPVTRRLPDGHVVSPKRMMRKLRFLLASAEGRPSTIEYGRERP